MSKMREYTTAVMDAMDQGILDPRVIADVCLNWLSEADVKEMTQSNDISPILKDFNLIDVDDDDDDDDDEED